MPEPLRAWVTLVPGDLRHTLQETVEVLPGPIDLMIHDSDHSREHEMFEFRTTGPHLSRHGVLLRDNGHATTVLRDYIQDTGVATLFGKEQPKDHPYPGAGIGLSVRGDA